MLKFCLPKSSFSSQRRISKQAKQKGKERGIANPPSMRHIPQHAMRLRIAYAHIRWWYESVLQRVQRHFFGQQASVTQVIYMYIYVCVCVYARRVRLYVYVCLCVGMYMWSCLVFVCMSYFLGLCVFLASYSGQSLLILFLEPPCQTAPAIFQATTMIVLYPLAPCMSSTDQLRCYVPAIHSYVTRVRYRMTAEELMRFRLQTY